LATGSTERPPDRHALGRSRGRSIRTYRDDGDTLIEILVTIAIVGLTIAAIMGAFVVDVKGSVEHRQLARTTSSQRTLPSPQPTKSNSQRRRRRFLHARRSRVPRPQHHRSPTRGNDWSFSRRTSHMQLPQRSNT